MLDNVDGGGVRKKSVRRSAVDRAAIVAQQHGIVASQLSTWRTAAKRKSGEDSSPAFADLSVMADALSTPFDGIEVVVGPVSVRLPKNTMPKRIADIAHRLAQGG